MIESLELRACDSGLNSTLSSTSNPATVQHISMVNLEQGIVDTTDPSYVDTKHGQFQDFDPRPSHQCCANCEVYQQIRSGAEMKIHMNPLLILAKIGSGYKVIPWTLQVSTCVFQGTFRFLGAAAAAAISSMNDR